MSDVGSFLQSKVAPPVWASLAKYDAIIAGGALTSYATNKPVNDLDIYFRNKEDFTGFISDVYGINIEVPYIIGNDNEELDLEEINDIYSSDYGDMLKVGALTNKSIMMRDKETETNVQAITYKFFATPEDIFADYDFSINKAAYECKTGTFTHDENFLLHNSQRYLSFSADTTYPIISLLRVRKYEERGYKISKSNMLKIAMAVSRLKLESWKDVREHCGGMYGIPLEKIFPDTEEFSIDAVIDRLSTVTGLDETAPYKNPGNIALCEVIEKFSDKMTKTTYSIEYLDDSRIFKNVILDTKVKEQLWRSVHTSSFTYQLDKVVNGGTNGIYGYYGLGVVGGQYWNHGLEGNSWVLELEPFGDHHSVKGSTDKIQMMGDWKVTGAWKSTDFQRRFRKAKPETINGGVKLSDIKKLGEAVSAQVGDIPPLAPPFQYQPTQNHRK